VSASTGTIDLPPAAPAAACTVSVPTNCALTVAESSVADPKCTPSSTVAKMSTPVTLTAMPAPMPTLPSGLPAMGANGSVKPSKLMPGVWRLPEASAAVVKKPLPVEIAETEPPEIV